MIIGTHAIIYNTEAEAVREFFRDKLGFRSVDAGGGWLIFALPPAELGIHPIEEGGHHELYLLCDDLQQTIADLQAKGVEFSGEVIDARFGLVTSFKIPGGGEMSLYQPKHPMAIDTASRADRA